MQKKFYKLKRFYGEEYSACAFVNLTRLINNVKTIKSRCGKSKLCAVVKADAYGHGLCRVASAIKDYADFFAVANMTECMTLRNIGITNPIICLLPTIDYAAAAFYNVTVCVGCLRDCFRLNNFLKKYNVELNVHIAVNTGMNRLGFDTLPEMQKAVKMLSDCGAKITGIFSHFYNSTDLACNNKQYLRFLPFVNDLKCKEENVTEHICSSGSFLYGDFNCDMVRIGLLMYGYKSINAAFDVQPIMKIHAEKIMRRKIGQTENLLYGNYCLSNNLSVDILKYGYSNGLPHISNGLNDCCMNLSAQGAGSDFFNVLLSAEKIADITGEGIYRTLLRAGQNVNKIYYYE